MFEMLGLESAPLWRVKLAQLHEMIFYQIDFLIHKKMFKTTFKREGGSTRACSIKLFSATSTLA
jgi:hypothetical protein